MLVNVVDQVSTSLELCSDVDLIWGIERLHKLDNVRVLAWGEDTGLLVVLRLFALFEVLFVDDFQGNCHAAALVSCDFHCANWRGPEIFCVKPVLMSLIDEALHLEKLV